MHGKMKHMFVTPSVHRCNICCITALTDRTEYGIIRGCYKDLPVRAMEVLEGKDHLLDGNYTTRKDAISKCILVGMGRGYPVVGIQGGGMCVGSPTVKYFNKYGISHDCKSDGKGGPWATEVHALTWIKGRIVKGLATWKFFEFRYFQIGLGIQSYPLLNILQTELAKLFVCLATIQSKN